MLLLNGSVQLEVKVAATRARINDVAAELGSLGRALAREAASKVLQKTQDDHVARVLRGEAEIVCRRCGVVHSGGHNLQRRGTRMRKLKTSSGELVFRLKQVTCRDCGATWSPFPELLGLAPRQRIAEELERTLVEAVADQSYAKTTALGARWLGVEVSPRTLHRCVQRRGGDLRFTPAPDCKVAVADGTKVPAGRPHHGTDVRIALQLLERVDENGRRVIQKRIAGWGIGPKGWLDALPAGIASETIITDREAGIPQVLQAQHPGVRHQLCEWHVPHTMAHLMALDHVPVLERKRLVSKLSSLLWKQGTEGIRERYRRFCDSITMSPRAQAMLRDSESKILYDVPSAHRTSSAAEREMREINRRTDVGVQWSVAGVNNMLKLRHAIRLNPDDFDRLWRRVRPVRFSVVPQA
jgi:hypothetical protein